MLQPQLVRYALVGLCTAAGYFAVASLLHAGHGIGLEVASFLAMLAMHPLSYLGHRYITFRCAGPQRQSAFRFALTATLSTSVAVAASSLQSHGGVPPTAALLVNCLLVPVVTFLSLKLWVFAAVSTQQA